MGTVYYEIQTQNNFSCVFIFCLRRRDKWATNLCLYKKLETRRGGGHERRERISSEPNTFKI